MKLQFKLALYNTLTKIAIFTFLGILILVSINHISVKHLQKRLIQKKAKFVSNLSTGEINDLLTQQKTFTDYNLLKEEYIILKEVKQDNKPLKNHFSQEIRSIEDSDEEYQILTTDLVFEGTRYELELGETMATV